MWVQTAEDGWEVEDRIRYTFKVNNRKGKDMCPGEPNGTGEIKITRWKNKTVDPDV